MHKWSRPRKLRISGVIATSNTVPKCKTIDMALQNAQLVTVAVLDARFAASNAEIKAGFASLEAKWSVALEKTKAEVVRWVFLVLLGNVALSLAANALLSALQHPR